MHRVLIADNDIGVVAALQRELLGRFEVFFAPSATLALRVLHKVTPSIVVAGFGLEGMNGAEFLGLVKSRLPGAARVLISDSNEAVGAMGVCGSVLFVRKPWEPGLSKQLSELLNAGEDQVAGAGAEANP